MKRTLHLNLAQAIKLMLITLMCLPVWSTAVKAQSPEAYAVFDSTTGTLTFKYDAAKPEGAYEMNEDYAVPGWYDVVKDIKKIVFEPSFADARPTSCHYWFSNYRGEEIEGLEYLNTSEVTNMVYMFSNCTGLKNSMCQSSIPGRLLILKVCFPIVALSPLSMFLLSIRRMRRI